MFLRVIIRLSSQATQELLFSLTIVSFIISINWTRKYVSYVEWTAPFYPPPTLDYSRAVNTTRRPLQAGLASQITGLEAGLTGGCDERENDNNH